MADVDLLKMREFSPRQSDDRDVAAAFAARAADVRAQVVFLLGGGLSEGAREALGALAEEDMVDFCIMVDLANGIDIADVLPLEAETQLHLSEFLDEEPWRSLAVDNDMTVVLAMIEDVLAQSRQSPWHRVSPRLPLALANLMDRVDREQYLHFAGELEARLERHDVDSLDGIGMVLEIVHDGARRVGAHPPAPNRLGTSP
ncbi:MAG: hypothetical protein HC809_04700 [Gammaproteobacteria bacterium]|nr:hypothetical protein [Gammaproteobacteria bacterium]